MYRTGMARRSILTVALVVALAIGIAMAIAAFRQGDTSAPVPPAVPAVAPETAAQRGVFAAEEPARLLAEGRWPGLPVRMPDKGRTAADLPDLVPPPQSFEQAPLRVMFRQYEELPEAQRALAARLVAQRLTECLVHKNIEEAQLQRHAEEAYLQWLEGRNSMTTLMQPTVALRAIDQAYSVDASQWMDDWIAKQRRMHRLCDGTATGSFDERWPELQRWRQRAAELGDLESKFERAWTLFLLDTNSGDATRLVELKHEALQLVDEMLEMRYAPVLLVLAGYADHGYFQLPDTDLHRAYLEAYARISANPSRSSWRWHSFPVAALDNWLVGFDRNREAYIRALSSQRLERIQRWADAIESWPDRQNR